jgi:L-lactate dehydrogenase complex protein LldG
MEPHSRPEAAGPANFSHLVAAGAPMTRVARDEVLETVGEASARAKSGLSIPRRYRRHGALDFEHRVALFCERVGEYRAVVTRVHESGISAACAAICTAQAVRKIILPPGLPHAWRPANVEQFDGTLGAEQLDGVDGAITGCTAAIAETGTIILTGGPREGKRAITLVPDVHICVVLESQIVELVPEAFELIARESLERRPITLVSGPSATSDIELSRVEGVHGPRRLFVLVVKEPS